jgi:hypothetical protein
MIEKVSHQRNYNAKTPTLNHDLDLGHDLEYLHLYHEVHIEGASQKDLSFSFLMALLACASIFLTACKMYMGFIPSMT